MRHAPLRLHSALGQEAADKRIDILHRVAEVGSISEAARNAGVSYKAAWQAIDTLSNLAGTALVESAVGGVGGGGARLTEAGRQLLRAADELSMARAQVLSRLARPGPGAVGVVGAVGIEGLAALGLRTSMRNQLPCTVKALKRTGGSVRVALALSDGTELASRITRESAQLLSLAPGVPALALCKATAVVVSSGSAPESGRNRLTGHVTRRSRAVGGEVALHLSCGLQVVGFAAGQQVLRLRSPAVATLDEASVVLASTG